MNAKKTRYLCVLAAALVLNSTQAASLTWNNGAANMSWNTTSANWGGATLWNNATPDSAIFGATGVGTVSLSTAITAGSVTFNTAGYALNTDVNTLTATTIAGSSAFTKTGAGQITLSGTSPYTGAMTIRDGIVQLNSGATVSSGTGITIQGGAGTVGGTAYPFKGITRGGVLYLRDDTGAPGSNQVGTGQTLALNNGSVLWFSGSGSDTTTISTVALTGGFNSIANASSGGAPDLLTIGNLTRSGGATVEFRAAYSTLGTGEAQIKPVQINGTAIANVNGILGGWAFVSDVAGAENGGPARSFATWNASATIGMTAGSVVAATPDKSTNTTSLATGISTENWQANGNGGGWTVAANTTINSLVEQSDVLINSGATLTLGSGGLIFRNNNFWLQSSGVGYITSGTNDLYLQTDGGTGDQSIKVFIKDGGAGAVTLRKSGPGLVQLNQINTYTGGTFINQGTLDLQAGGQYGCIRGAATVNAGGILQLSTMSDITGWGGGSTGLTTINLNGGKLNLAFNGNQTLGSATINMTGGSITGTGASARVDFYGGASALNTLASADTATISVTQLNLRQSNTTFTVADGNAAIDLAVGSTIMSSTEGNGVLVKAGAGTMALTGASTYTGGTTINNGILLANNTTGSATGSGTVSVNSGGTLGGTGTISGAVNVVSGGTLTVGGLTGTPGTLTLSGNVSLAGNTVLRLNKGGSPTSDKIAKSSGTLAFGGTLTLSNVGAALVDGDSFTIFAAGGTDSFASFSPANPDNNSLLAWDTGLLGSSGIIRVRSANTVSTPAISLPSGGYVGAQSVTISCATSGATIYYTTNGLDPTTSSSVYSGAITVPTNTSSETLKAMATYPGWNNSAVASATYSTISIPVWTNTTGGSWLTTGNWQSGVIGSGVDATVDFSAVDLTAAAATVTLDGTRTVGGLKFGSVGSTYGWILNTGGGGPLTLDVTSGSPVINVVNQTATIGAVIAGNDGMTKTGNGTLVLTGNANSFSGDLVINAGTVIGTGGVPSAASVSSFGAMTNARSIIANGGSTLWLSTTTGASNPLGGGGMVASHIPALVINGGTVMAGRYSAIGAVTLQNGGHLSNSSQETGGSYGGYQFIGDITVAASSGTDGAFIDNNGALSTALWDHLKPGTTTFTVANITGGGNDLTVSTPLADGSNDYAGVGGLTKAGNGTMVLTGTNTYTGATTVNAGTLLVNSYISTGAVTVNGGILGGTGIITGPVTVNSGGVLTAGTSDALGTLTINGDIVLSGNTALRLNKGGAAPCDKIAKSSGTLTFGGTLTLSSVGAMLTGGESFIICAAGGIGSFTTISPATPNNDPGFVWDTTALNTSGIISVVAVGTVTTPVFSPEPGGYLGAQSITLSCTTAGAAIYYTTDGSEPTVGSTPYSSSITVPVDVPKTIRAIAVKEGSFNSAIGGGTYYALTVPVWTTGSGGSWPLASNWLHGAVGSGTDVTADFSTLDLSGGSAAVTLDGARTVGGLIFGDTSISHDWTLATGGAGPLTLDVTSGSPAINVANRTATISAVVTGSDGLSKTGNGTLVLSTIPLYTGATTVNGGTLKLTFADSATFATSSITVNNGATLDLAHFDVLHYSPGVAALTINSGGTVIESLVGSRCTLANTVTMTGGTLTSAGTGDVNGNYSFLTGAGITATSDAAGNPATVSAAKISIQGSPLALNVPRGALAPAADCVIGSVISEWATNSVVNKTGDGVLSLTGNNIYTGNTNINNGVLSVGATGHLYSAAYNDIAVITINSGGTLRLVSFAYDTPGGTGQLSVYAARRVINGGTLEVTGSSHASGNDFTVGTSGGTFRYKPTVTSDLLTLDGNVNSDIQLNGLLACDTQGNITVNEVIAGTGGLTKTGAATLTLNATNTYAGTTTVAVGTLAGTGTLAGAVTVESLGTLTVGGATGTTTGTLTINGALTLSGNTVLRLNRDATSDKIAKTTGTLTFGGTLTLANVGSDYVAGDSFTLFATGGTGSFSSITPANPNDNTNLVWDTSLLESNGIIRVMPANTVVTPAFTLAPGGYIGGQSVGIVCGTSGADIYFTTNGTDPKTNPNTHYTGPIPLPTDTPNFTIKAFATNTGWNDSAVATGIYSTLTVPVWTNATGGSWPTAGNWQFGAVGTGPDVTADFSTLDLTAASATVTLDGARTIGGLKFADTSNTHDWTVSTGTAGPLTLDVTSGSPVINVGNRTATIGAVITGTDGLTKTGNGTLALSTQATYTGGTTVNGGVLSLTGVGGASGIIRGSVTVNPSATLRLAANDCTGYGTGTDRITSINLIGGTLDVTTNGGSGQNQTLSTVGITMNAGAITGIGTTTFDLFNNGTSITTVAAATPSTISGLLLQLRQDETQFIIADGAAIEDLAISAVLTNGNTGNHNLIKSGLGTMVLAGANTYTGATNVNAGTLTVTGTLAATAVTVASSATLDAGSNISGKTALGASVTINSGGHLAFHIAATAAAQVTRTITGTLTLSTGNLVDVLAAATPADGTYTLVTAAGITGGPATGTTLSMPSGRTATLSKSGNSLVLTVATAGYTTWMAPFITAGLTGDTTPTGDPDNDGITNLMEYVLNGNPGQPSQAILPTRTEDPNNFIFTFTRRVESATDTTQVFEYGTNLTTDWTQLAILTPSTDPRVVIGAESGGTQTVTITIPKGSHTTLFGRLQVSQP